MYTINTLTLAYTPSVRGRRFVGRRKENSQKQMVPEYIFNRFAHR
jgi:hypothetical protein